MISVAKRAHRSQLVNKCHKYSTRSFIILYRPSSNQLRSATSAHKSFSLWLVWAAAGNPTSLEITRSLLRANHPIRQPGRKLFPDSSSFFRHINTLLNVVLRPDTTPIWRGPKHPRRARQTVWRFKRWASVGSACDFLILNLAAKSGLRRFN